MKVKGGATTFSNFHSRYHKKANYKIWVPILSPLSQKAHFAPPHLTKSEESIDNKLKNQKKQIHTRHLLELGWIMLIHMEGLILMFHSIRPMHKTIEYACLSRFCLQGWWYLKKNIKVHLSISRENNFLIDWTKNSSRENSYLLKDWIDFSFPPERILMGSYMAYIEALKYDF